MARRFADEGLTVSYDGLVRQTTLSHRLIAKAYDVGGEAMQLKTVAMIYKTYFSEGKDIGSVEVLAPIAAECGVFGDGEGTDALGEAKKWLNGDEGMEEYRRGIRAAQNAGISGVPFFRWVLSCVCVRWRANNILQ